jgi:aryl-alcohol dehydrogenase-like predicted oxidoreductase
METENDDHSLFVDSSHRDEMYQPATIFRQSWDISKQNLGVSKHKNVEFGYFLHRRHHDINEYHKQLEVLSSLYNAGEITYTGLSEVSLEDLKYAQTKVPIHFLETEFSMNVQFILTDKYMEYCISHNIHILAYSPLSRGFWSEITSNDDALKTFLQYFNMWKDDNFQKLLPMLQEVQQFAKRLGYLTSQIALAWIMNKGGIPIAGSSSYKNNQTNIDAYFIKLNSDDIRELDNIVYDMTERWGIKRYL